MTLEQELSKHFLYLERLKPKSVEVIQDNLEIAKENILKAMSTTNNQRQLRALIKKEVTTAFSGLDALILDDVENVTGLAWNSTGAILTTYLAKDLSKRFIKFDNLDDTIKKQLLNPKQLILGNNLNDYENNFIYSANNKLRGAVLQGLQDKVGVDEVRRNLDGILGNIGRNQVRTVARTAMLSAINQAKEKQYSQMFEGVDVKYKYSAVLDSRTSIYCVNANGYMTDNVKNADYRPNSHYNCRSMWIPTTKAIEEYESKQPKTQDVVQWDGRDKVVYKEVRGKMKKTYPNLIHHRDGTTSTKFTHNSVKKVKYDPTPQQFFNSFDEKFKIDYMGKKKYEIYKANDLSFKDMLNSSRNDFLTVEELTKKLNR